MIKPIKFDLNLADGTRLATLDDVEGNLTPDLFGHFHSGKLTKWLRVRRLEELADKMEALQAKYLEDKNELDMQLFKNLCEIFVSEVDENETRKIMQNYKKLNSQPEENSDDEVEQLEAEIELLKTEIDKLERSQITVMCKSNEELKSNPFNPFSFF